VFWSLWRPLSGCFTRVLIKYNNCPDFMSQTCRWISVYDKACFVIMRLLVCFINVSRFNPYKARVLLRRCTLSIIIIFCPPALVTKCVTKVPSDFSVCDTRSPTHRPWNGTYRFQAKLVLINKFFPSCVVIIFPPYWRVVLEGKYFCIMLVLLCAGLNLTLHSTPWNKELFHNADFIRLVRKIAKRYY